MATAFKLPNGWYRNTIEELFDGVLPATLGPLTSKNAWSYIYGTVLWCDDREGTPYLHLVESSDLARKGGRAFANSGMRYLTTAWSMPEIEVVNTIDQIGRSYAAEKTTQGFDIPKRRDPNVTGGAFEVALQICIERLAKAPVSRTPELSTLQGFELAPVAYHSRPDLALFSPQDFRLLVSTKWTLRKERIGTYLHEAYFYKQRRPDLQIAFVVSDFRESILTWLLNDPLVDRVYHVNLPMLLEMRTPFGSSTSQDLMSDMMDSRIKRERLGRWLDLSNRLFDLSQLFDDIGSLKAGQPIHGRPLEANLPDF